ncbi:MAG: hypothetical protein GYA55_04470 [SAR324 cluster bacterium]|uniref:Uncharacterized protein n=1 Tax=SAR324 cluster bacterium TaxID=2024889 RepID=A0A7X9FQF1_9DELT|nr:hypothetical protein [SAR324 cluster bacterium]
MLNKTINHNVLFGVAKSALTYIFIVYFYKVAQDELVHQYIRYEVGLAFSTLLCFGLQSRSYKLIEFGSLRLLGLVSLIISIAAQGLQWIPIFSAWGQLIALIALDRFADIMQQDLRQRGQFLRYNLWDMFNQLLTKVAFLLLAFNIAVMPYLLFFKSIISLYWILRQVQLVGWKDCLLDWQEFKANRNDLKHYISFDVLNYLSSHLDLLLLNALAPTPFLMVYFYVRKFLRIPLILLNYVLDPAYVNLRKLQNPDEQFYLVKRLWKPAAWIMSAYCLILVIVLPQINPNPLIAKLSLLLFLTSACYINLRMIEFSALLFWSQRTRSLTRLIAALSNVLVILLAIWTNAWGVAVAIAPFLGVLATQWIVGNCQSRSRAVLWPILLLLSLFTVTMQPFASGIIINKGFILLGIFLSFMALQLSWVSITHSIGLKHV